MKLEAKDSEGVGGPGRKIKFWPRAHGLAELVKAAGSSLALCFFGALLEDKAQLDPWGYEECARMDRQ